MPIKTTKTLWAFILQAGDLRQYFLKLLERLSRPLPGTRARQAVLLYETSFKHQQSPHRTEKVFQ